MMKTRNPMATIARAQRPQVIPDKRAKREARLEHKALLEIRSDNRGWSW